MTAARTLIAAAMTTLIAAAACAPAAPAAPAAPPSPQFTPVLTVKELMAHVIDPVADWVFDAAVTDITASGITEIVPTTDEDWLKVERGAITLAESANLLKIRRQVAPSGGERVNAPGTPAPELSTQEIQARIDGDLARWEQHADDLRVASLEALAIIRSRQVDGIYKAGTLIDNACEACHLEYWYPGDRSIVEADAKKKATYSK